jgi:glyoxylase-like metal-dependent hydrolase (beta-lactamase superfamily II)
MYQERLANDLPQQLAHSEFTGKPIIGGKDCEGVTKTPENGGGFKIGDIAVKALYTPCHTQDSICWLMEDSTGKAIFTGDTLFHGGTLILEKKRLRNSLNLTSLVRMWPIF